jgi:hypothetical protein
MEGSSRSGGARAICGNLPPAGVRRTLVAHVWLPPHRRTARFVLPPPLSPPSSSFPPPPDLQKSLAAEQASAAELVEPVERLRVQIEALEQKKSAISAHIAAMQAMRDTSDSAIRRLLQETLAYKDMLQALHQDQGAQVPRTK